MKKLSIYAVILWICCMSNATGFYGQNCNLSVDLDQWNQKNGFANNTHIRYYGTGFSINDKGYVGLGFESGFKNDLWEYDPANDSWVEMTPFPGAKRYLPTSFTIGDFAYVGLGSGNGQFRDFWRFDPANNSWLSIADYPGGGTFGAVSFVIDGVAYVGTGKANTAVSTFRQSDFWKYDPIQDIWSPVDSLPGIGQYNATAFSLLGKGYVVKENKELWEYNPGLDQWSLNSNYPYPGNVKLSHSVSFNINDKAYIGIGVSNQPFLYEFDPMAIGDPWTQQQDLPLPRYIATSFSIDNKGYIATGYNNGPMGDLWEFSLAQNYNQLNHVTCQGANDGSITIQPTGGSGMYNFQWSTGSGLPTINNLSGGEYEVTITDNSTGCVLSTSYVITEPTPFDVAVDYMHETCDEDNAWINVTVGNGISPYSYAWNNGETTEDLVDLSAGVYSLTITDGNGCSQNLENQNCSTQPSGMTSWWSGDGNANDSYGANHGSGLNGTGYLDGKIGESFNFDGIDDLVEIPDGDDLDLGTGEFSISFWVKPNQCSITDAVPFITKESSNQYDAYSIGLSTLERFIFVSSANSNGWQTLTRGGNCVSGQWHFLSVTQSQGVAKLYVNGVLADTDYSASVPINTSLPLYLGYREDINSVSGNQSRYFDGQLDEIEIYSRALTEAEIQSMFNSGNAGACQHIEINDSEPLLVNVSIGEILCNGEKASVELDISGGNEPYNINWSTGEVSSLISNLSPADYGVSVSDLNGCSWESDISITEPDPLDLVIDNGGENSIVFNSGNNGIATSDLNPEILFNSVITGGVQGYSFSVDGVLSLPTFQVSYLDQKISETAGVYSYFIEVVDGNNCMINTTMEVEVIDINDPEESYMINGSQMMVCGPEGEQGCALINNCNGGSSQSNACGGNFMNLCDALALGFYPCNGNEGKREENNSTHNDSDPIQGPKLYPNPTSGKFRLEALNMHQIIISDVLGKEVYSNSNPGFAIDFDLTHLNAGLYIIGVLQDNSTTSLRLIIR